jgi:nucleotide-binding universal stress UspA family protein
MARRLIVHPTDFTLTSDAAFKEAIDLAQHDGASLIVVHVIEPPSPVLVDRASAHSRELMASQQTRARVILERMMVRAKLAGVSATDVLVEGTPDEQITRLARKRRADLIVMGTRGRVGLKEIMIGSTAERVIGRAHCPVVTVRSEPRAPRSGRGVPATSR